MFSTVVSAHEYTVMFITLVNGLFDHLSGKMGVNVRFKLYAIIAVLHLVYLAVFAYTRDQGASGIRQQSVDMHMRDRQQTFDRGTQLVQSLTGIGGDDERIWLQRGESFTSRLVRLIGLVEYENTRIEAVPSMSANTSLTASTERTGQGGSHRPHAGSRRPRPPLPGWI